MSVFARLMGINALDPARDANDPRWWGGTGSTAVSGVHISPETALKLSTVWACVGLLSETIASLPLIIYRYLENEGGRSRARNHPLYDVLHSQPNANQTAFEFTQMMQAHALLRGSGYSRIRPGPRGFADHLEPIHPDQVRKEKLENGRIRYIIDGKPVNAEDVFEVGGLSLDGVNTLSVIGYARDSLGLGMAAENYGSRFFRNDSRPGGILTTDAAIKTDVAQRTKAMWESAHSGSNQHRVAVLGNGMKWQQVGISPEDAQFLQTREYQAEDICRWFRVPPHMVGLTSKQTSWGTGIEQMSIGFVTYTLRPWLVRWSQAIQRDLILDTSRYFADFVVEGLLRGDTTARYNAYAIARQWGWMSVNDIRGLENMNPIDNGNKYLEPLNMIEADMDLPAVTAEADEARPFAREHYRLLAEEAAGRLVRKEKAAITRIYERGADVETAVSEFYTNHTALVAQSLRIPLQVAADYCQAQRSAVATYGLTALADETAITAALANLALGDTYDI